ncbi:MAG TPA: ATP-binding cassette domain-containing protein, partial [Lacipirellulaceae bacterium]|nr:ATP-binding cassette domain-containing protein [Lacipirellulaceae bacterium]
MLALHQVRKGYVEPNGEWLPILDVDHLAIGRGEQVVLRGRSGCGKTTLLNCIAGLSTVDSGRIEVDGRDVTKLPEAARDRFRAGNIGFVFQNFNLLPAFTALENVMLGMAFVGGRADAARARQLLADVGLDHR